MKRSVVLLTLATLLLAVLAYGEEAQKPAKEAPPPGQRIFFPAAQNLQEAYGKSAEKVIAVVGTIHFERDLYFHEAMRREAQRVLPDKRHLAQMVRPAIQGYYANLKDDQADNVAAQAAEALLWGTCPKGGAQLLEPFAAQNLLEAAGRMLRGPHSRSFSVPSFHTDRAQPVTSELPLCQVLLVTNEPDLAVEVVTSLCHEVARTLSDSEQRVAQYALTEKKAYSDEVAKNLAELERHKKELEEKYKFCVHSEAGKDTAVYVRGAEFTGPLRDKLAKLQELQFGNDLRSASVQAQLDYVRTTLAKEPQMLQVTQPLSPQGADALRLEVEVLKGRVTDLKSLEKAGRASHAEVGNAMVDLTKAEAQLAGETVSTVNPVWASLKQRLVELETESAGLNATVERMEQMLAQTQAALDDAAEYLSLTKTLDKVGRDRDYIELEVALSQAPVTRIEQDGPFPLPYVVQSARLEQPAATEAAVPGFGGSMGPAGGPAVPQGAAPAPVP